MKICTRWRIAFAAIAGTLVSGICSAGLYGNDTAATARPIFADGTTYIDHLTPTNLEAWFVFRAEPNQSYAVEVWSPNGKRESTDNECTNAAGMYESDGTTPITTTHRWFDTPSIQPENADLQSGRETFISSGGARPVTLRVYDNAFPPTGPHDCAVRVMLTTLASARWSVNGYSDFIAISNVASSQTSGGVQGSILYFDESGSLIGSDPFTLAAGASVQIVKANGVAIGGATRGGIRIVHNGAPGSIVAHQLWYNPVTNAYIQYPFFPLVHSYARGGI